MKDNKKQNLLYTIIGVMTLAFSVIGATYAYYTFSKTTTENITGDMATITFNLKVALLLPFNIGNFTLNGTNIFFP